MHNNLEFAVSPTGEKIVLRSGDAAHLSTSDILESYVAAAQNSLTGNIRL